MGWKATGSWHGYYSYDPVPDCPELPTRVGFGMQLQQSWLLGSLKGEVWDEPPSPPDRGVIEGRVSSEGLFFLKWMPVCYLWWDGRPVTFAEYMQREFDTPVDEPVPNPPIRYTGVYRAAEDELSGTWEYAPGAIQFVSRGRVLALDLTPCSGSWTARRSRES